MITKYIGIPNAPIELTSYITDFLSSMIDTLSSGELDETPEQFVRNESNYNPTSLLEYMSFEKGECGLKDYDYRKSQTLMILLIIAIKHSETVNMLMHISKDMCRLVPLRNGIWIEIYERTNFKPFTPCE